MLRCLSHGKSVSSEKQVELSFVGDLAQVLWDEVMTYILRGVHVTFSTIARSHSLSGNPCAEKRLPKGVPCLRKIIPFWGQGVGHGVVVNLWP